MRKSDLQLGLELERIVLPVQPHASWVFAGPDGSGDAAGATAAEVTDLARNADMVELGRGADDFRARGTTLDSATVDLTSGQLSIGSVVQGVRVRDLDSGIAYELVVTRRAGRPHLSRWTVIAPDDADLVTRPLLSPAVLAMRALHFLEGGPARVLSGARLAAERADRARPNLADVARVWLDATALKAARKPDDERVSATAEVAEAFGVSKGSASRLIAEARAARDDTGAPLIPAPTTGAAVHKRKATPHA